MTDVHLLPLQIEFMNVGDKLWFWFNTGARGAQMVYCEVLKVGAKKIRVRNEFGGESWHYPWRFDGRTSQATWDELFPKKSVQPSETLP